MKVNCRCTPYKGGFLISDMRNDLRRPGAPKAGSTRQPITLAAAVPPQTTQSTKPHVLADRIAAALVHREPGWRLPRRSMLARRYSASMADIDSAINELIRRSLLRRLPDGQLYRASPAEYLIPLEGIGGLSTWLDPMGGEIACQAGRVSQRAAPQDVALALDIDWEAPLRVFRCVWAADGEPVALSTAYVPEAVARSMVGDDLDRLEAMLRWIPAGRPDTGPDTGPGTGPARATAVDLELSPAQPSVARSLQLSPGQPAISVTIRFDDPAGGTPVGLTVVTLKPDRFRVVVQAGASLTLAGQPGAEA
jgi:DNA-binding GntR family transcriptional regulator